MRFAFLSNVNETISFVYDLLSLFPWPCILYPPNLKYIDDTNSPVIKGITNGFIIIKNKVKLCVFFCFVFFAWHFCNRMSVWQYNWHTKDPDSNTCRNWYFRAANVLLFIRRRAIGDYKPKAPVSCVVFLTISHWAISAVLLYILTLTIKIALH